MSLIPPSSSLQTPSSELPPLPMAALKVKLETNREINLDTTFIELKNAWEKQDGCGPIKSAYKSLQILYSTIHDSNNVYDSQLLRIGALDATKRKSEKEKLDEQRKIQIQVYKEKFTELQTLRETALHNVCTIDFVVNKLISLHENKIYDINHSLTMSISEKEKLKEYQTRLDKLKRYSTELTDTTQKMKELVKQIANHTLLKSEHQLLPAYCYSGGGLALRTYRHFTEQGGNLLGGTAKILGATSEVLAGVSGYFMSFKADPFNCIDGKTSKPTPISSANASSSSSSSPPLGSSSCSPKVDSLKSTQQTPSPLSSEDSCAPPSFEDLLPRILHGEEPTNLRASMSKLAMSAKKKTSTPTQTFIQQKADESSSESSTPMNLRPSTLYQS